MNRDRSDSAHPTGEFVEHDAASTGRLPLAVREFLNAEPSGGIVLMVAAVCALIWANSPWDSAYTGLWDTEFSLSIGDAGLRLDLRHWVNDALMALFFFVVGVEIKRELVVGELRDRRAAALPAIAAAGGMVVPAAVYALINIGQEGSVGWGIPMATDIAFAMGVLALLGNRIPSSLKIFLLSLAIVDDIGAIAVIAIFYSSSINLGAVGIAGAILLVIVVAWRCGLRLMPLFILAGIGLWFATHKSGVHATVAGVVLGLLVPARPDSQSSLSLAERFELRLHPWTSYVVIPLFAFANAGVKLDGDALTGTGTAAVAMGVGFGLVVGKMIGITAASAIAVRFGIGQLPAGTTWRHILGVSAIAGIGFTVSLFITELAFASQELVNAAKLAVLAASLVASLVGVVMLRSAPSANEARLDQLDDLIVEVQKGT